MSDGMDGTNSALNSTMLGSQAYSELNGSQRALSPEDVGPIPVDTNALSADVANLEQQLAQPHGLQISHVQQPGVSIAREISLSSDTAQNTSLPAAQAPEKGSLGEDSVNDSAARTDDTMDDILRFFLKVRICMWLAASTTVASCCDIAQYLQHMSSYFRSTLCDHQHGLGVPVMQVKMNSLCWSAPDNE